jgi:hypothetical protein
MRLTKKRLQRKWTHAHEEDSPEVAVYRPVGTRLQRSRGRRMFELGAGGRYAESTPGPADKPLAATATWEVDGDTIVIRSGRTVRKLTVASLAGDRLEIKKPR